ncbi:MAG: carbohydrate-binding domain-containing protein [Paludibacteraceae bacterium]|nr:carbohydrate-binding domain-containing protein [Paludibacteraceae bacterium]
MKKILLVFSLLLSSIGLFAQVSIADTTYYVLVSYSGNSATVEMTDDVKSYVTASVNGADVTITSTASAAINEITYGLTGSTTDGSFTMVGTYKATMELFGITITNPTGPAIDIQNGKRIEISAKSGTTSTLKDGTSTATDAWKGALQCKGHIQFKGKGTLNVYGNYNHAIRAGEYIEMKNCTINVYSAVKDAINCNQYFLMESGEINLSGFGDDGIQVSKETNDTSAENTGNFTMNGGIININMYGATGESVKAEGTKSVASAASLNVYSTQSVDQVPSDQVQSTKVIRDGQVVIERGEKKYNMLGAEIK